MADSSRPLTAAGSVAVSCRGLTKTFGQGSTVVHALQGIDLDVHPGELLMLVGPSGCGKTTLISVIAGILNRTAGQCTIFSNDLHQMSNQHRTRYRGKNIGFVFQAFNLLPTLTAAENVAIPQLILGTPYKQALDQAQTILAQLDFNSRMMQSLPKQLSGGQQQRVALARAVVHQPRLIVCDEPTSALDHQTGHKVMELLRSVALQNNRVLIVVTHDARIFEFADRIAHMDDGRITDITDNHSS